jgi:hypothetical protein
MTNLTINIDMDRKCAECGKGGAADSGLCLTCASKTLADKPMRSAIGRAVQRRTQELLALNLAQARKGKG